MAADLMDGAALAESTLTRIAAQVADGLATGRRPPVIATVLVGDDPSSHTYVRMKVRRAQRVGMEPRRIDLPASTTTAELVAVIQGLSADPGVDGVLLQHPVPDHIDERAAFEAIPVHKDVDGVTYASFARMEFHTPGFASATPGGILRLLDAYDVQPAGLHAVVVGQGPILGKPLSALLLARGATVTSCHRLTRDLRGHVERADLLVAAVGRAGLIPGEWIKPGAVVIDAGYNPGGVGDVEFEGARQRASLITPVPGGVGPMTIAVLLDQTVQAWLTSADPAAVTD
ncbi:bifunctional 5,10-methylenetetrahydrofolate dehydrogenase/5,10-methenyltetrahydrofolate cyclohydrolase [uncultured Amnibacterium sp.]|uniref:bifunctional 5,10-methylenetetrahydrofolate dehydrogenase/5,10-methenyltetrahydrofolate cyclohydrolase n=1 Tax=uncultured Amnibacterium sp. TaxID=1631851 RepID=UPI0035C9987A